MILTLETQESDMITAWMVSITDRLMLVSASELTNIEQARAQRRSIGERKKLKTRSFEFILDPQLDPDRFTR